MASTPPTSSTKTWVKVLDAADIHRLLTDFQHSITWYDYVIQDIKKGKTITLKKDRSTFFAESYEKLYDTYCDWWLEVSCGGHTCGDHDFTLDSLFHFVVCYQLWAITAESSITIPEKWCARTAMTSIPKYLEGEDLKDYLSTRSPEFLMTGTIDAENVTLFIVNEYIFRAMMTSPVVVSSFDDPQINKWWLDIHHPDM